METSNHSNGVYLKNQRVRENKMKKILLFVMLLATVAMTSCSKDSAKPTLVGKWKFVSVVYKSANFSETINGSTGDYMDFKKDGKLEFRFQGETETIDYTISGSKVLFDGSTYSITNLTSSAASLYNTEGSGSDKFEQTVNLKK
jgi:hypothetical protein